MEATWIQLAAVVAGFLIRLALPLLLTLLLAWFLRRLDARWQREAAQEAAAAATGEGLQPGSEAVPALAARALAARALAARTPCWQIRHCQPDRRQLCPAYNQPDTPCWEIFRPNGRPSDKCLKCVVWRQWHPDQAVRLTS